MKISFLRIKKMFPFAFQNSIKYSLMLKGWKGKSHHLCLLFFLNSYFSYSLHKYKEHLYWFFYLICALKMNLPAIYKKYIVRIPTVFTLYPYTCDVFIQFVNERPQDSFVKRQWRVVHGIFWVEKDTQGSLITALIWMDYN